MTSLNQKTYKILTDNQWKLMQEQKRFKGSEHDIRDGFIHLANKDQVEHVIKKYFQAYDQVNVIELSREEFGENLKLENGFPHLYNMELEIAMVTETKTYKTDI